MSCRAIPYHPYVELAHLDLRPANIFLTTSATYRDMEAFDPQRMLLSYEKKRPSSDNTHCSSSSSSSSSSSGSVSLFDSILNARSLHETEKVPMDTTDHVFSGIGRSRGNDNGGRGNDNGGEEEEEEEEEESSCDPRLHVEKLLLMRRYVMKLGDFGHCCRFDERHVVEEGATRYCARELIRREGGAGAVDLYKADIFSLGVLVYELCLGGWVDEWMDG